MKQLLTYWKPYKKFFVLSLLGLSLLSILLSLFVVPYRSTVTLQVNDSVNNFGISSSRGLNALSKDTEVLKKGNSFLRKNLDLLKTDEFYNLVQENVISRAEENNNLNSELSVMAAGDKENFFRLLEGAINSEIKNDYQLRVSADHSELAVANELGASLHQLVPEFLTSKEKAEIESAKKYLVDEQNKTTNDIQKLFSELQTRFPNSATLSTNGANDELMKTRILDQVRDLETKIDQNSEMIRALDRERDPSAPPSLYGIGGAIEQLKFKNQIFQSNIHNLKQQLARYAKASQADSSEHMGIRLLQDQIESKKAHLSSLTASLDKMAASDLAIGQRYSLVENSRANVTKQIVSMKTLLFLSVILACLMTITLAFINNIWNAPSPSPTDYPTHEKDVVVLKVELKEQAQKNREIRIPLKLQPFTKIFQDEEA